MKILESKTLNKFKIGTAVSVLIASMGTNFVPYFTNNTVNVQAQTTTVVTDQMITDAQTDVNAAQKTVSTQESVIADLTNTINQLQNQLTIINNQEKNINSVSPETIAAAKTAIDNANKKLNDALTTVSNAEQNETSLATNLTAVQEKIVFAEQSIAQLKNTLQTEQDTVKVMQEKLENAQGSNAQIDIFDVNAELNFAKANLDKAKTTLNELNAKLVNEKNELNAVKTELSQKTAELKTKETGVVSLEMVSHRGFNRQYPESTRIAYTGAYENGYRAYEADVRFTSDGIPVINHDPNINYYARNNDGSGLATNVNIRQHTLSQLNQYDFGLHKGEAFRGTKILTYEQLISDFASKPDNRIMQIELKELNSDLEKEQLYNIAQRYGVANKIQWISFNWDNLQYFVNRDPNASVALLANSPSDSLLNKAKSFQNGRRQVDVSIYHPTINRQVTDTYHAAGMRVFAWTVNDRNATSILYNFGVDGIVTDSSTDMFSGLISQTTLSDINTLKSQIETLKHKINTLSTTIAETENAILNKNNEIAQLQNDFNSLSELKKLIDQTIVINDKITEITQNLNNTTVLLATYNDNLVAMQESYDTAKLSSASAKTALTTAQENLRIATENYELLVAAQENGELKLSELQAKKAELNKSIEDVKLNKTSATNLLKQSQQELVEKTNYLNELIAKREAQITSTTTETTTETTTSTNNSTTVSTTTVSTASTTFTTVSTTSEATTTSDQTSVATTITTVTEPTTTVATSEPSTTKNTTSMSTASASASAGKSVTQTTTEATTSVNKTNNNKQLPKTNSQTNILLVIIGFINIFCIYLYKNKRN